MMSLDLATFASSQSIRGAIARQALNYCLYALDDDGCPADRADRPGRGGWQEDAHTDKLHNFVDAMNAFPEWAK